MLTPRAISHTDLLHLRAPLWRQRRQLVGVPDPSDGDEDLDVDDEEDDEGDDADDEKPRHGLVPEVEVEVEVEDRMVVAVRTLRIMADSKNVTDNSFYIIGFQC